MENGTLSVGDSVTALVYERHRMTRSHTATHLLHAALREHLGTHVTQRGSLVDADRLRFDFSHHAALTSDDLHAIEGEVYSHISLPVDVTVQELPKAEAEKLGAMMLFGEKYGETVRVVSIDDDYSIEFCGGTHVKNTSEIGLFKIISESSAAAGVRRIEAVTGQAALDYLSGKAEKLAQVGNLLGVKPDNAPERVEALLGELKAAHAELKALKATQAGGLADTLLAGATEKDSLRIVVAAVETDDLGALADEVIGKISSGVTLLATASGGKVQFVAKATKDAVAKGVHCGNLVKAAAQVAGGGGGGRPDFAQAGGKDATKLQEALDAARGVLVA
jgi:alanyl-tRNA synthetase